MTLKNATRDGMPQGGSGKQGGNLMSSGNSKKKMSSKPRYIKAPKSKGGIGGNDGGALDLASSVGHTLIPPNPERRAEVMRAQRAVLQAQAERSKLAARRKGATRGGHVLGSSSDAAGAAGGESSSLDVRAARLLFLERQQQQQQQSKATAASAGATSKPTAATSAAAASAAEEATRAGHVRRLEFERVRGDDDMSSEVLLLLDLADERLQDRTAMEHARTTLCTVLRNAATKGIVPGGDSKYLTLRAGNDKLWGGLLCHPEMVAVLCAAGFEPRQLEGLAKVDSPAGARPSANAGANAGANSSANAAVDSAVDDVRAVGMALEEQLDGSHPPDPAVVESLVARLAELSTAVTPLVNQAVTPDVDGAVTPLVNEGKQGDGGDDGGSDQHASHVGGDDGGGDSDGTGGEGEIDIGDDAELEENSETPSFTSSAAYAQREFELVYPVWGVSSGGGEHGEDGCGAEELAAVLESATAWCSYAPSTEERT